MIEKILRFAITHPFVVLVVTCMLGAYGIYSFTKLPIDAVPDITNNQVQINAVMPGFSPEQMERQITYPVETAFSGIPGLEMTRSLSRNGFAQVTAIFEESVNIYFARQQLNERLNTIRDSLPNGADIKMGPISTGLGEVSMWTIDFQHPGGAGAENTEGKPGWQPDGAYLTPEGQKLKTQASLLSYLRTVQDWIIRPQLKSIQGLAEVDSIGGYVHQYHIEPDVETLLALGLTFNDVVEGLERNNVSIGPGYIERNGEAFSVVSDGKLTSPEEIENTFITTKEGLPLRLKDIANVTIGKEMRTGSATENGHEVVIGTALMLIGANSRTVAQAVEAKLQNINQTLPPDIKAMTVLNREKLVDQTIHTVSKNLIEGALLVIAVLFFMLGYFKAAFATALVIPLSMLMTAIGMVQTRISGNLMSLGAIDFGLIVDGAVIITENCLRRLGLKQHELGRTLSVKERLTEVMAASKEMIQPTVYGQAIIIMVYIPLLSLTGVEGKMFHPMAATVIFALVAAFILSITFIPAMIGLFVTGKIDEKENLFVRGIKKVYQPMLNLSLLFPSAVIALATGAVIGAAFLFTHLGQEFVPTLDEQDIALQAARIPSTSLTQSTAMQMEVEKTLKKNFPEVAFVFSKTGTAEVASDPMPPNLSDTFVMLKPRSEWPDPHLPKNELIEKMEATLQKLPGNIFEFTQPIELRFNELIAGVRSDVAVKVYGDDFGKMQETAQEIAAVLNKIKGAADVKVGQTEGLPLLDIKLDRNALSRLGLNAKDALDVIGTAIGGTNAGQVYEGDRRFDLIVRLPEEKRYDLDALRNLPVRVPQHKHTLSTATVPINEIADLTLTEGLNEIRRENGKRFVAVEANVRGNDLGSFVEEAKADIAKKVKMPPGYWVEYGGQFENLISARNTLMFVVPLAFLLIFALLYSALDSVRNALLVFTGVPLAWTGGILTLWLRDMPFSISAAVGFIALSGIAVLNGLVMLTYIQQLIDDGVEFNEAVSKGALTRLRPVLITALVASLGFIPMALATGVGAEVQKPLATVVIGGLISSTLLTLFVLPALYKTFASATRRREKITLDPT